MEKLNWFVRVAAAATIALAACGKPETTQRAWNPSGNNPVAITANNAAQYDRQQQTVKDISTMLKALQKKVKNMPRSVGFGTKSAKDTKIEWQSLKDQLTELRKDLDATGGNPELKNAMDELTRTIESMLKWLEGFKY